MCVASTSIVYTSKGHWRRVDVEAYQEEAGGGGWHLKTCLHVWMDNRPISILSPPQNAHRVRVQHPKYWLCAR